MDIHVVQAGDTIFSIAEQYKVTVDQLLIDNGLENADNLVIGQTIVIVYPRQTYTVQEGDSISSIARNFGITINQLLRNNPTLNDKEFIYPGDVLVISYNTIRELSTNGFVYPYISMDILKRSLPYLTFLSIFNYRVTEKGNIISYGDDTEIIRLAKIYGTLPLLMISTLTPQGEPNLEIVYEVLLNEEYQDNLINTALNLLTEKGLSGVNLVISSINLTNQNLYIKLIDKFFNLLNEKGFLLFVTINPNIKVEDGNFTFEKLDYNSIAEIVYRLTFIQYYWGVNKNPPAPVSSIAALRAFMDYIISITSARNISIGKQLIAYDWTLPYKEGETIANSLTLNSALALASDTSSQILFDEVAQAPYFYYYSSFTGEPFEHIVWSIDARSIKANDDLIIDYGVKGSGIWNLMIYYQQLWTIMISEFDIIKLLPEKFQ